jgi:hypothetical protein
MSEDSTKGSELKTSRNTDPREWHLEVTEEQYQESKAKGIEEEALFKPGTHVFRRRDPEKIIHRDQRTVVLHLDEKTFKYFQQRAEAGSNDIESEIKEELRAFADKEAA